MSNVNAPFGLKPINLNGTTWSGQGKLIYIPSSQGALYIGDPLVPLAALLVGEVRLIGPRSGGPVVGGLAFISDRGIEIFDHFYAPILSVSGVTSTGAG